VHTVSFHRGVPSIPPRSTVCNYFTCSFVFVAYIASDDLMIPRDSDGKGIIQDCGEHGKWLSGEFPPCRPITDFSSASNHDSKVGY